MSQETVEIQCQWRDGEIIGVWLVAPFDWRETSCAYWDACAEHVASELRKAYPRVEIPRLRPWPCAKDAHTLILHD